MNHSDPKPVDPHEDNPPPADHWHKTEAEAYYAAEMVHDGKSAGEIATVMFGHRGEKELNRVSRLIKSAFDLKYLTLTPPLNKKLEADIAAVFPAGIHFHVVNNDQIVHRKKSTPDHVIRADIVCRKAAELVAARIHTLLTDPQHAHKTIVIANAGGLAVSRVVQFLSEFKQPVTRAAAARLQFISLNSASIPNGYELSANVLAVRMAYTYYGARHIVRCHVWPDPIAREYRDAVKNIDLLLCGAGSERGILFTWLKDHAGIELPPGACGDICLSPLNGSGAHVKPRKNAIAHIEEVLHPAPTYEDLDQLAVDDKIIYVATGHEQEDQARVPGVGAAVAHSKLAVTRAVLTRPLTRTCVLGATLARDLIAAPKPAP